MDGPVWGRYVDRPEQRQAATRELRRQSETAAPCGAAVARCRWGVRSIVSVDRAHDPFAGGSYQPSRKVEAEGGQEDNGGKGEDHGVMRALHGSSGG